MTTPTVRALTLDDLEWAVPLNNEAVPAVNSLSREAFIDLLAEASDAFAVVVDGRPSGVLVAMQDSSRYDSPNFRWFGERYLGFRYVDRVIVAPWARGQALAGLLYDALVEHATNGEAGYILAEVNEDPPNPASHRFHERQGFRVVGRQSHPNGKTVLYYERRLASNLGTDNPQSP